MKIKVFAIVCIGAFLMLGISSALIYTQVKAVQGVSLDPLADSLQKEDSKVLTWILSSIPVDKVETLKRLTRRRMSSSSCALIMMIGISGE